MDIPYTSTPRPDTGVYNAKIGIWLFLASEVMLFGGLFSAYVLLRVGAAPGEWPHGWLNVWLGTFNTLILALSAITTLLAWVACKVGQFGRECYRIERIACRPEDRGDLVFTFLESKHRVIDVVEDLTGICVVHTIVDIIAGLPVADSLADHLCHQRAGVCH